jgi:hypothetical protein
LVYAEPGFEIEIDDRSLAHLQIVLGSKLRRHESFFFSWVNAPQAGSGRASIWLDHAIPLFFDFDTTAHHCINRDWIDVLSYPSSSLLGVIFVPEPPGPGVASTPLLRSYT